MKYTTILFKKMDDGLYTNPGLPYDSRLTKETCEKMINRENSLPKGCSKVYLDENGNYMVEIEEDAVNKIIN